MIETYQAVILGIIQGLTEFLPVSSSGHLVLGQHLFGLIDVPLYFDVSLHIGTLGAVCIVFFKDIKMMIITFFNLFLNCIQGKRVNLTENSNTIMLTLIVVGSVPTAFLGLMFSKVADKLFSSVLMVGFMLIVTGTFLWLIRRISDDLINKNTLKKFTLKNAIIIGIVQGFAVIPGISRSGSTIVTGLFLGLSREMAAKFSFLLSIPAIIGATVLSFGKVSNIESILQPSVFWGTLASFVVGYFALIMLLRIVKHGRLYLFAPYCWGVGIIAVISTIL